MIERPAVFSLPKAKRNSYFIWLASRNARAEKLSIKHIDKKIKIVILKYLDNFYLKWLV
jgi:hypothetical protein